MRHPDIVNTGRLGRSDFQSTSAAEAATEVGADQGEETPRPGEGGCIAFVFVVAVVLALAAVAHWLAGVTR